MKVKRERLAEIANERTENNERALRAKKSRLRNNFPAIISTREEKKSTRGKNNNIRGMKKYDGAIKKKERERERVRKKKR